MTRPLIWRNVIFVNCVTVLSIFGLNLLLHMTSRAESATLSTIRPNLFVNFSAPQQKSVKVSLKLASETGMVPQRHHALALLHNYNYNGMSSRLILNSHSQEDSAAEVTESITYKDPVVSFPGEKANARAEREKQPNSSRQDQEYSNAERIDAISSGAGDHGGEIISKDKSEDSLNFWFPSGGKSQESGVTDLPSLNSDDKIKNQNTAAVSALSLNYSNEFSEYSGSDYDNAADTYADFADHNRYFVKVKAKPRDAFVGLGFSSIPIPQSIEPQILISAVDSPLPLSFKLNQEPLPLPKLMTTENLENKLGIVPNYIDINSRDVEIVNPVNKELFTVTTTSTADLIADVTQKYGKTDSTSIPGMAGIDYPILGEIPATGFDCQKQRYKGFFADLETKCQAWHYCDFTDGHSTFLCPNGTLFSQVLLTCDWWFNVDCRQAQQLYVLNERLYRYIKAPKPSFPEDYHGPQVDHWLREQLNLGLLPKMKKIVKDKVVIQDIN